MTIAGQATIAVARRHGDGSWPTNGLEVEVRRKEDRLHSGVLHVGVIRTQLITQLIERVIDRWITCCAVVCITGEGNGTSNHVVLATRCIRVVSQWHPGNVANGALRRFRHHEAGGAWEKHLIFRGFARSRDHGELVDLVPGVNVGTFEDDQFVGVPSKEVFQAAQVPRPAREGVEIHRISHGVPALKLVVRLLQLLRALRHLHDAVDGPFECESPRQLLQMVQQAAVEGRDVPHVAGGATPHVAPRIRELVAAAVHCVDADDDGCVEGDVTRLRVGPHFGFHLTDDRFQVAAARMGDTDEIGTVRGGWAARHCEDGFPWWQQRHQGVVRQPTRGQRRCLAQGVRATDTTR